MINKQASSFQYFHLPASILNYLQLSSSFPYYASIYFFSKSQKYWLKYELLKALWLINNFLKFVLSLDYPNSYLFWLLHQFIMSQCISGLSVVSI